MRRRIDVHTTLFEHNASTRHPAAKTSYNIEYEEAGVSKLAFINYMSRDMIFPILWHVRLAKAQTSLHIRAV